MDSETIKWLEEALSSTDSATIMKEKIASLQIVTEKSEINNLLNDLFDLIENLDGGMLFCQINGMPILLNIILEHKDCENRVLACQILSAIAQNQTQIQKYCFEIGGFRLFNLIANEFEIPLKEAAFSALSAMIRGVSLEMKRNFIDIDGVDFIFQQIFPKNISDKLNLKALLLLKDLVYYDEQLHLTDIEEKIEKKALKFQKKKENIEKNSKPVSNELEENKKYKNIVKNIIIEKKYWDVFEKLIKDVQIINIEARIAVMSIIKSLMVFNQEFSEGNKVKNKFLIFSIILYLIFKGKWSSILKSHFEKLEIENTKTENVFDNEIHILNDLLIIC